MTDEKEKVEISPWLGGEIAAAVKHFGEPTVAWTWEALMGAFLPLAQTARIEQQLVETVRTLGQCKGRHPRPTPREVGGSTPGDQRTVGVDPQRHRLSAIGGFAVRLLLALDSTGGSNRLAESLSGCFVV